MEALLMAEPTWTLTAFQSEKANEGDELELDIEGLMSLFSEYAIGPKAGSCFVPGKFRSPRRVDENVASIGMLVLDLDHSPKRPEIPHLHFWYETWSGQGRYRIVIPFKEYYAISNEDDWSKNAWPKLVKHLDLRNEVDEKCRNAARIYYPPRKREGEVRECGAVDGELFDWRGIVEPGKRPGAAPEMGNAPAAEGSFDLAHFREELSYRAGPSCLKLMPKLLKGESLTPPPDKRQPDEPGRRSAWQAVTANLSMVAPDGTPWEVVWPLCQASFESMCADDSQGFEPEARKADIVGLLSHALDTAAERKLRKQRDDEAAARAIGRLTRPKGEAEGKEVVTISEEELEELKEQLKKLKGRDGEESNVIRANGLNISTILAHDKRWQGSLRFNDYTLNYEIHGGPTHRGRPRILIEEDFVRIANWFSAEWDMEVKDGVVKPRVLAEAMDHTYDPLQDYLRTLEWDGVPRIAGAFENYLRAEKDELTAVFSKKWFIAAAARALDPGCQFDNVLVLEGLRAGERKTTALRVLGGEYFSGSPIVSVHDKDTRTSTTRYWIRELGELDAWKRGDTSSHKDFLSRREEDVRIPYAKADSRRPRRCVFVGTTNDSEYNHPDAGMDRRLWCVSVGGRLDIDGLARDREQLWAEAIVCYEAGVLNTGASPNSGARGVSYVDQLWWLSDDEEDKSRLITQTRTAPDFVAEQIQAEILKRRPEERQPQYGGRELMRMANLELQDKHSQIVMGAALKRLGFFRRRRRGEDCSYYKTPEKLLSMPQIRNSDELLKYVSRASLETIDGGLTGEPN